MRKQKTFDRWSQGIEFINSISMAFDLSSISMKWVKVWNSYHKHNDFRLRVIVNYK